MTPEPMTTAGMLEREVASRSEREGRERREERDREPPRTDGSLRRGVGWNARRAWVLVLAVVFVWSWWRSGAGPGSVNARGWPLVERFLTAAVRPELSSEFLDVVVGAAATTVGFALAGTALSILIGLIGGVLTSETWWERDPQHPRRRRGARRGGWWFMRVLAAVPRGIHEAVWALFLLQVLGRDPMVAVLAIGIPFDDAAAAPYAALRAAGAGRFAAMSYALVPAVLPDVVSYGFYRLECSLRSAVVLGMIGAGGLGFQVALSFQSLRYGEIWTLIYVLVALSAVVDRWSAAVRHHPSPRRIRVSAITATVATAIAAWRLELRPWSLFGERSRRFAGDLAGDMWPPRLPAGGWSELWSVSVDTVVISVLAIGVATALAWPVAFLAARDGDDGVVRGLLGWSARSVLLVTRSIPPPVWALMIVFVIYPGPLPGGLALGLYTFGVLGRLDAEVVENSDARPNRALRLLGASRVSAFGYGTVPEVAPRFTALSLYRWEVTMRETVIVGLVGAGGLGRLLAQQNAAFDRAGMVTTVGALILLSFLVDVFSARVRRDLR